LLLLCLCQFFVLSQEIGWEERLRIDLFCVGWDVKPQLNQFVVEHCISCPSVLELAVGYATHCRHLMKYEEEEDCIDISVCCMVEAHPLCATSASGD